MFQNEFLANCIAGRAERVELVGYLQDRTLDAIRGTLHQSDFLAPSDLICLDTPTPTRLDQVANYLEEQPSLTKHLLEQARIVWMSSKPFISEGLEEVAGEYEMAGEELGLILSKDDAVFLASFYADWQMLEQVPFDHTARDQVLIAMHQLIRWCID